MIDTLLWIEDDPNDILLGRRAMEKVGITSPLVLRDGREAKAYLVGEGEFSDRSRHPLPSVILLDLKLPKISGHEMIQWIRRQDGLRRIPIIVFTSSREMADIDRAYDLGANAYLVKGVDFKSLVDVLGLVRSFWLGANRNPSMAGSPTPSPKMARP